MVFSPWYAICSLPMNIKHDIKKNIMSGSQERIEVFENKDKKKYRKKYKKRVRFREIKGID